MLTYNYVARDPVSGRQVKAGVQADSESSAAKLIRAEGLVPVDISVSRAGGNPLTARFNKVKTKDKILFSRQLSTLLNAGLPLLQSLRSVNAQTQSKPLRVIISEIIADVEGGSALAASMGKHPDVFNQVYLSLIAAGETSGTLDSALERLANQQEKDADILAKIKGAMIYPLIILVVMAVVVGFMLVKVLPQVKELYSEVGGGASLPLVTRILMGVSDLLIHQWWIMLIVVGVIGVFTSRWVRTLGGKSIIDKFKMRAWPFGPLFMKLYMARFSRTSTTLVGSGVPLIQVLEITARAIDNVHITGSLNAAIEKVKGGKSLGDALTGDPNFLELVPNMLKIGEQSGSLEQMLAKAADYYEKELDQEVKNIQTLIEPVMMVIMGIVAFTIVAAVLLPIYSLAGSAGNVV
ncbi:MAG: type II secretion system F family protein [Candidatus Saccharimonadales bacterium]